MRGQLISASSPMAAMNDLGGIVAAWAQSDQRKSRLNLTYQYNYISFMNRTTVPLKMYNMLRQNNLISYSFPMTLTMWMWSLCLRMAVTPSEKSVGES